MKRLLTALVALTFTACVHAAPVRTTYNDDPRNWHDYNDVALIQLVGACIESGLTDDQCTCAIWTFVDETPWAVATSRGGPANEAAFTAIVKVCQKRHPSTTKL